MNQAADCDLTAVTVWTPAGMRGVRHTLGAMRRFVREARRSPAFRQIAVSIVFLTPERDELAEVHALFDFVRDKIRYLKDILGVETVSAADKTLVTCVGDCDDQAVLLCALFESIGYQTRFVVTGYVDSDTVEHVYCQVFCDGIWIDCDPTEQHYLGWAPPDPVVIYYEVI